MQKVSVNLLTGILIAFVSAVTPVLHLDAENEGGTVSYIHPR